jgi:hypothetical protein
MMIKRFVSILVSARQFLILAGLILVAIHQEALIKYLVTVVTIQNDEINDLTRWAHRNDIRVEYY